MWWVHTVHPHPGVFHHQEEHACSLAAPPPTPVPVTADLLPGYRVDGLIQVALVSLPSRSGHRRCVQAAVNVDASLLMAESHTIVWMTLVHLSFPAFGDWE